jgi:hypothetical protein
MPSMLAGHPRYDPDMSPLAMGEYRRVDGLTLCCVIAPVNGAECMENRRGLSCQMLRR